MITRSDVMAARARLGPRVHRTPVHTSRTLDALAGAQLWLKCEHLQRGGSFKLRGALNAVLQLPEAQAAKGVVTHSSGNFAAALGIAAAERGIPAHIVMPSDAPAVKQAAVADYGGRITLCAPTQAAREQAAAQLVARTGGTLIPPFDHPHVIAGQGTIALELQDQVPDLDLVIAPIGGGGLSGGIAAALAPTEIEVWAAEPAGADDAARSKAAGQRLANATVDTIADGLRVSIGAHNWPLLRDHIAQVRVVDDGQIRAAMRLLWERCKLVVEPSAAVPLAAALSQPMVRADGRPAQRVALVLSGGNIDLDAWTW